MGRDGGDTGERVSITMQRTRGTSYPRKRNFVTKRRANMRFCYALKALAMLKR